MRWLLVAAVLIAYSLGLVYAYRPHLHVNATEEGCPGRPKFSKVVLCYYEGRVPVSQLDPCLCSHVVLTNAARFPNGSSKSLIAPMVLDPILTSAVTTLKQRNPDLLVLGRVSGSARAALTTSRGVEVADTLATLVRNYNLDGLEVALDWDSARVAGGAHGKRRLVALVKGLRVALLSAPENRGSRYRRSYSVREEIQDDLPRPAWNSGLYIRSNGSVAVQTTTATAPPSSDSPYKPVEQPLILLQVSAKPGVLGKRFDLKPLTRYVDLFTVPTHNLTDESENQVTYHQSRLFGLSDILNTDSVIDLLIGLGAPASRLVMTIPAAGLRFQLNDASLNKPRSPAKGIPQLTSHQEVCQLLLEGGWMVERDEDLTAPYAFHGSSWIAFDDELSVEIKGKYALLRDLAGAAIYAVDDDDLVNACGRGRSGLTRALASTLVTLARRPRSAVLQSLVLPLTASDNAPQLVPVSRPTRQISLSPYRIVRIVDRSGAVQVVRRGAQTEFECSRQGYYTHPQGCDRFYRCVKFDQRSDDYSVFEYDCPPGLAFDEKWEVCMWPGEARASCAGSSEIRPVPRNKFSCSSPGFYADPENCRWFFACMDHRRDGSILTPYEFRCPYGLGFDERNLMCNWPWLIPNCAGAYRGQSSASLNPASSLGIGVDQFLGVHPATFGVSTNQNVEPVRNSFNNQPAGTQAPNQIKNSNTFFNDGAASATFGIDLNLFSTNPNTAGTVPNTFAHASNTHKTNPNNPGKVNNPFVNNPSSLAHNLQGSQNQPFSGVDPQHPSSLAHNLQGSQNQPFSGVDPQHPSSLANNLQGSQNQPFSGVDPQNPNPTVKGTSVLQNFVGSVPVNQINNLAVPSPLVPVAVVHHNVNEHVHLSHPVVNAFGAPISAVVVDTHPIVDTHLYGYTKQRPLVGLTYPPRPVQPHIVQTPNFVSVPTQPAPLPPLAFGHYGNAVHTQSETTSNSPHNVNNNNQLHLNTESVPKLPPQNVAVNTQTVVSHAPQSERVQTNRVKETIVTTTQSFFDAPVTQSLLTSGIRDSQFTSGVTTEAPITTTSSPALTFSNLITNQDREYTRLLEQQRLQELQRQQQERLQQERLQEQIEQERLQQERLQQQLKQERLQEQLEQERLQQERLQEQLEQERLQQERLQQQLQEERLKQQREQQLLQLQQERQQQLLQQQQLERERLLQQQLLQAQSQRDRKPVINQVTITSTLTRPSGDAEFGSRLPQVTTTTTRVPVRTQSNSVTILSPNDQVNTIADLESSVGGFPSTTPQNLFTVRPTVAGRPSVSDVTLTARPAVIPDEVTEVPFNSGFIPDDENVQSLLNNFNRFSTEPSRVRPIQNLNNPQFDSQINRNPARPAFVQPSRAENFADLISNDRRFNSPASSLNRLSTELPIVRTSNPLAASAFNNPRVANRINNGFTQRQETLDRQNIRDNDVNIPFTNNGQFFAQNNLLSTSTESSLSQTSSSVRENNRNRFTVNSQSSLLDATTFRPQSLDATNFRPQSLDATPFRPQSLDATTFRPQSLDATTFRPQSQELQDSLTQRPVGLRRPISNSRDEQRAINIADLELQLAREQSAKSTQANFATRSDSTNRSDISSNRDEHEEFSIADLELARERAAKSTQHNRQDNFSARSSNRGGSNNNRNNLNNSRGSIKFSTPGDVQDSETSASIVDSAISSSIVDTQRGASSESNVTRSRVISRPVAANSLPLIEKLEGATGVGITRKFDRYGPGGWRSANDTLGPEVCNREGLFRHPHDCNKFYECFWDSWKQRYSVHIFNCPIRLSYDPSISACNWPVDGPGCSGNHLVLHA